MIVDDLKIDSHKLHLHPERVSQWMNAKTIEEKMRVFPLYVEVSPVGHCNHRCTFCAVDYIGYKPRSLDFYKLGDCIQSMAESGVKSIMYAGEGEPLMHKRIVEIVKFTKLKGIDVAFTTNGVLMSPLFVEGCMSDISWIKISLNAGDAETYSQVHQTKADDFTKVWNNINYAVTFRNMHNLKTMIGIQTVVLPENIHTISDLLEDASIMGVDYAVLKPYSQHHSSINKYNINYQEWDEILSGLVEQYSSDKFKVIYRRESALKTEAGYSKCFSTPNFWSYVMADGSVYSCSAYLLDDRFKLGNINEQSFEEIWLGDKRKKNLEFVENELDISECRLNCRMDKSNQYLWQLKNPSEHVNFI